MSKADSNSRQGSYKANSINTQVMYTRSSAELRSELTSLFALGLTHAPP